MLTIGSMHRELLGAWNRRDFQMMRTLLHADYTYVSPDGKQFNGTEAGLQNAFLYAQAFPDSQIEIKQVYVQGDTAIAELVARGTHRGALMGIAPTGRSVETNMCNVMEFREGKIYREREYFDRLAMLEQLGVVPANTST
jgi:steroid delta-isomerase-like uncharacterized protein